MFPLKTSAGSLPHALDQPDSIVLTRKIAQRFFGREDVEIPLLPLMRASTTELLSTQLEGPFRHAFVCSAVEQLLCLALAALADRSSAPARLTVRDRRIVQDVRRALDEHLLDPLSIETLTENFGINRNKLRFAFKEMFGTSMDEYVSGQKMQLAFDLLTHQRHTVNEVAANLGYAHACNFATAFKRRFGRTPAAVRHQAGN